MIFTRSQKLFLILNSAFLTFLLVAEFTGPKLFDAFGKTFTLGVIPFPVTFLLTDILNEYYGKKGVRLTTALGFFFVIIAYSVVFLGIWIPASPASPVDDESFRKVFANSGWLILGSLTAYLVGQIIDIQVFHVLRKMTQGKYIWLRATGSTIFSQLLDSFIVIFIALQSLSYEMRFQISTTNFLYKILIAIAITPLVYLSHSLIQKYLGEENSTLAKEVYGDTSGK